MAQILNLQTRPERLRRDQEELARQVLLPLEGSFRPDIFREIMGVVDRRSPSRSKWSFVMLSPHQNYLVVKHINEHSSRPKIAAHLWAICFCHLRSDTGEITLSREGFAEELETTPENVSRIMTELVSFGAISRRRQRVAGLRGPGLVQYFMNPRVGTHLSGVERDKAQDDAPLLRAIEGGRP